MKQFGDMKKAVRNEFTAGRVFGNNMNIRFEWTLTNASDVTIRLITLQNSMIRLITNEHSHNPLLIKQ